MTATPGAERLRLEEDERRERNWRRWGPYLSERQWGTVREDYSAGGDAWTYLPHDHARSRAYRWGEDGLLGIADRECRACLALALWNGRDPILKERLFGLSNPEGNHGEDVKELYYYLDATPTASYLRALYKYPQAEFPYARLVAENARRGRGDPEYELEDTGVLDGDRYFDVQVEYAKAAPDDVLVRVACANRGPEPATLHLLPTLWLRNTWAWGRTGEGYSPKGRIARDGGALVLDHATLGRYRLECAAVDGRAPRLVFTDNETDVARLFGAPNPSPFVKDAFHRLVVDGDEGAVNPAGEGTKAAAWYRLELPAGGEAVVRLRLAAESAESPARGSTGSPRATEDHAQSLQHGSPRAAMEREAARPEPVEGWAAAPPVVRQAHHERAPEPVEGWAAAPPVVRQAHHERAPEPVEGRAAAPPVVRQAHHERAPEPVEGRAADFDALVDLRKAEADAFHAAQRDTPMTPEERSVARQADAGLVWSRQFYHLVVEHWLEGDPAQPPPPPERSLGRNRAWTHLWARDVLSVPDAWEYPWFAAWDLAFHCVAMARTDPAFAKRQLLLLSREWYQHPDGQLPAYEWSFGDVNPPVHAWAAWRVYQLAKQRGWGDDRLFLESVFQKSLLEFTWWVNREDVAGNDLFAGGFLGLDNIGFFDRSRPLPGGGVLEQADATAWMAFYCTTMLAIALELAREDPAYADVAATFFERFVGIARAMNDLGGGLWDEEDGFYYDRALAGGVAAPLRLRSIVGVVPLFAVESLDADRLAELPLFRERVEWALANRPEVARSIACMRPDGHGDRRLLAIPDRERLVRVLRYVLDEREFLSPFGVRSLSRVHLERPGVVALGGGRLEVRYEPAEGTTGMFGGNSNWRGPVWFPVNYLLVEALKRHHRFYGDGLRVECPTGSGVMLTLRQVAEELERRLVRLFLPDAQGRRPCHGARARYATDPRFRDLVLFHEYFDGDDGRGLGASHQTGWTALAANLLERVAATRAGR